jgi:hypothetical protein
MGGSSSPAQPAPMNTTTVTSATPTLASNSTSSVTQNQIPRWLEGTSQSLVRRADAASQRPYESYTGERVAGFTPMTQQAFDRIGSQQVAGQIGTATQLATQAGQSAAGAGDYDPFEMGGFTSERAQQYMNPYLENVLAIQTREAQREADIAAQTRGAAAVKAGAYGGGRQAIMEAEAARNLAQQKGDIYATGLSNAFETGRTQYQTEAALREQSRQFGADLGLRGDSQALQAAQTLGQLGSTQFQQEMDITQGLGTAGQMQQQQQQNINDVAYQDWVARQQYPYEQMSWLQGIISGVPHSTTQRTNSHTSGITTPGTQTSLQTQTGGGEAGPSRGSQTAGAILTGTGAALEAWDANSGGGSGAAAGGVVGYADGGITELMSDGQLEQRMQNTEIPTIARLAAELRLYENARTREGAQMGGAAPQGQPTVAEEAMAGIAAIPLEQEPVSGYAMGGVMEYAGGGETEEEPLWMRMLGAFTADERDVEGLMRDRERQQAAGADTRGIDQAIATAATSGGRNNESEAEAARLRRTAEPPQAPMAPGDLGLSDPNTAALGAREGLAPPAMRAAVPVSPAVVQAPVARAMPVVQPGGLGDTPEAATAAAPLAAPARSGSDALMDEMRAARAEAAQQQAELMRIRQAEADQSKADAEAERARFDADRAKDGEVDKEKRERISAREKGLDKQKKSAFNYALMRAGIAMMSGTSPYAMVNIGKGLAAGVEGYQADLAEIDKARENLRGQLDDLADLRAKQAAATGAQRRDLDRAVKEAERNAKYGVKTMMLESGVKTNTEQSNVVFKALLDHRLRKELGDVEHGQKLEQLGVQEAGRVRAAEARAARAGATGTRGQVTPKDLATARLNAAKEWEAAMGKPLESRQMMKTYGSRDAFIADRLSVLTGAPASTAQPAARPAAAGGWKVTPE